MSPFFLGFASCTALNAHTYTDCILTMDKKTKKRLEILRQKIEKARKVLAAAKQQTDEPDEIQNIEKQIEEFQAEVTELKNKN